MEERIRRCMGVTTEEINIYLAPSMCEGRKFYLFRKYSFPSMKGYVGSIGELVRIYKDFAEVMIGIARNVSVKSIYVSAITSDFVHEYVSKDLSREDFLKLIYKKSNTKDLNKIQKLIMIELEWVEIRKK